MERFEWRYSMVAYVFMLVGIAIVIQLVRLQVFDQRDDILDDGELYSNVWRTFIPPRGEIYDRSGNLLAGNQEVYEVGLELADITDPEGIAFALMYYLGLDYAEVFAAATTPEESGRVYIPLAMEVSADRVAEFEVFRSQLWDLQAEDRVTDSMPVKDLGGVILQPRLIRSYPEGTLASNLLGFVNQEGRGYFGVEEFYNDWLTGRPKQVRVPLDPYLASQIPEMPPGISLVLTIDRDIQRMAEETLDAAVKENDAESGTVVILDPETGAILAMATAPRIDLNKYTEYPEIILGEVPFNRAVSDTYEPGSVMKPFPMAFALDQDLVEPGTEYVDTGSIEVGGVTIRNWNRGAWGPQSMIGCMRNSLNVCMAWLALKIGPTSFYDYMQDFGFGSRTNVDLAGEAAGSLRTPGDGYWHDSDLGTNSFGQGVAVTPLQMAMAGAALANRGKMMTPHIVYAMVDNGVQNTLTPQVAGYPVTPEAAAEITEMLAISVEGESYKNAVVPGYRLAGKTGTGEIPTDLGYTETRTNASFIGWGPVDDPYFVVYVWLEKPARSIWGSEVAAPLYRDIVQRLVVLMDIPPDVVRMEMAAKP